ncbi:MAG: hypothetical protein Q8R02_22095 [Hyphomonadaceae bacterium]|nr:hypothetical protein [Hyphomonadaceae bacterium]
MSDWLATYPMNSHPEQGRSGAVCPFVKKSSLLDILRIGINPASPAGEEDVFTQIRGSFAEMERIPAPPGKERLRTIAIGYPNCDSPEGLAMLERVYKRHKYYTLFHFRMIAFFHAHNDIHGLWNPDFRPMRSPMPVLAIRYLIEQDSAFAAKHKIMTLPYLLRFGPVGVQRIAAHLQHKAGSDTAANP